MESLVALLVHARINASQTLFSRGASRFVRVNFNCNESQLKTIISLLNLANNGIIHYVPQLDNSVQTVASIKLTFGHNDGLKKMRPRNVAQLIKILSDVAFYQYYEPDDATYSAAQYFEALSVIEDDEPGSGWSKIKPAAEKFDDLFFRCDMDVKVNHYDIRPLASRAGTWQEAIDMDALIDDDVYQQYIRQSAIDSRLVPANYIFETIRNISNRYFQNRSRLAVLRNLLNTINTVTNLNLEI
jgi:hypothetical protein